ncbi:RuvC-like resolvase [Microbacterium phage RobinRose]|nr:RuvC-like resolvase [Microbacterium phage RobinRose]
MGGYQHPELRGASAREKAALQRVHSQLGSKVVKVGRWPFRRREWRVVCPNCQWEAEQTIPVMPVEMKHVENMLLIAAMEEHLVRSLRTLTLRQKWRSRG